MYSTIEQWRLETSLTCESPSALSSHSSEDIVLGTSRRKRTKTEDGAPRYPTSSTTGIQVRKRQRRITDQVQPDMAQTDKPEPSQKRKSASVISGDRVSGSLTSSTYDILAPPSPSKRPRVSSPTKAGLLSTLPNSIVQVSFKDPSFRKTAPEELQELWKHLRAIASGSEVIPCSLRSQLSAYNHDELHLDDWDLYGDKSYYNDADDTHKRSRLGASPMLKAVRNVIAEADLCSCCNDYEAGWNSAVHHYVLNLAKQESSCRETIDVKNITMAKIAPPNLLRTTQGEVPIQGKMVDFAIILSGDDKLGRALTNLPLPPNSGIRSLNPTQLSTILDKPIAVSIETKQEGESLHEGKIQLSVWAAAHLNHLDAMRESTLPSPAQGLLRFHPMLLVQGPDWYFLAATRDDTGRTRIWNDFKIGDVKSYLGVFKIITALQFLMDWADKEYRPWFMEHVLGSSS